MLVDIMGAEAFVAALPAGACAWDGGTAGGGALAARMDAAGIGPALLIDTMGAEEFVAAPPVGACV